jgi:hypothetical protein
MSSRNQNVAYRLTTEGKLFPIKPEEIQDMFVSVNILAFYFIRQKRLYVWIGENAPRELRNQIPVIEGILLKNHPLFTILRHFTLEGFRPETEELLDFLGISAESYKKKIEAFERFKAETSEALELAKAAATDAYKNEDFEKAVEYSNQVIDLAEKLFDGETRKAQEDFIQKILEKQNRTKELRIQNKVKILVEEYKEFDLNNNFDGAKQKLKEIQAVIVSSSDRGLKRKWETEIPSELEIREKAFAAEQEKRLSQEEAIVAANFTEAKSDFEQNLIKEDFTRCKAIIKRLEQLTEKTRDPQTKDAHLKAVESSKNRIQKAEEAVHIRSDLQSKIPEIEKLIAANDFLTAKQRINEYTETAEKHGLVGIVKSLSKYQDEVEKAEKLMDDQQQQINALSEKIELDDEQQDYHSGIEDCDKILALLIVANKESQIARYNEVKEKFAQKLAEKQQNEVAAQENAKNELEDQVTAAELDKILQTISGDLENAQFNDADKNYTQSIPALGKFHSLDQRAIYENKLKEIQTKLIEARAKDEIQTAIKECNALLEQGQLEKAEEKVLLTQALLKDEQKAAFISQFEPNIEKLSQKIKDLKEQAAKEEELTQTIEKTFSDTSQSVNDSDYSKAETQLVSLEGMIGQIHDEAKKTAFISKQKQLQEDVARGKQHKEEQDGIANTIQSKLQVVPDEIQTKNFDQAKSELEQLEADVEKLDNPDLKQEFKNNISELKRQLEHQITQENERKQMADEDSRIATEIESKLTAITQAVQSADLQNAEASLKDLENTISQLHNEEEKAKYKTQYDELSKKIAEEKQVVAKDAQLAADVEEKIKSADQAIQNADLETAETTLKDLEATISQIKNEETKTKYQNQYTALNKKNDEEKQSQAEQKALCENIVVSLNSIPNSIQAKEFDKGQSQLNELENAIEKVKDSEQKEFYRNQISQLRLQLTEAMKAQEEVKDDPELYPKIDAAIGVVESETQKEFFEDARKQLNTLNELVNTVQSPAAKMQYAQKAKELQDTLENKELIHKTRISIIEQQDQIRQNIDEFNFSAAEELIQKSFKLAEEYHLESEKEFLIQRQTELVTRKTQFDSWISNYTELRDKVAIAKENNDWATGLDLINKILNLLPKLHKDNEIAPTEEERLHFQKELELQQKAAADAAEQSQRELWAKELQVQINKALSKKNFIEAKTMCAELITVEEGIKNPTVKSELSGYIKETTEKIQQGQDTAEAKKRVKQKCESAQQALIQGQLDQAENDIKEAQSIVNAYQFEELKPTVEKTQERLKLERLYERLVNNITQNEREKQHRAGIENCKKIIEILPAVEKQSEEPKYQALLNQFNDMGRIAQEKEQLAQAEVKKSLEQMQTIMSVEADVLPTMEDIPIDDIIGDLNGSVDKIFETLNHVLEENRIEIKTEASSSSILRSASGEVVELQKTSHIENASPSSDDPDKASKPVKFSYASGLDNPFEDAISEAILEDIIPYDYEISEINVDGVENYGEPQKSTTKDGLSVKWILHDIPPKQKVAINYDLRQRIARTAIIPLSTQLKIIKTHANLSPLKIAGLYESKLTFKNEFQQLVKGLVFEDIIPQMYIYEVKRPDDEIPIRGEHSAGISVKWNVQKFTDNAKALHHYQLLEMFRFEELKMKIFKMDKEGYSAVSACDAETSYKKYEEIVKTLRSYVK